MAAVHIKYNTLACEPITTPPYHARALVAPYGVCTIGIHVTNWICHRTFVNI